MLTKRNRFSDVLLDEYFAQIERLVRRRSVWYRMECDADLVVCSCSSMHGCPLDALLMD